MSQPPIYTVSQFKPGSIQNDLAGQLAARQRYKEQLGDQITELAAHIHAGTFRLLELIREFDSCAGWAGEGRHCRSCGVVGAELSFGET